MRNRLFFERYNHKHYESIDSSIWWGIGISIISLFLPWLSLTLFEPATMQASWITLVQSEIPKIQSQGLVNYLMTTHYTSISISLLPPIAFSIIVAGLLLRKNWIVFTGSLFLLITPLSILYFLSSGIEILGSRFGLTFLSGIGLWGILAGSALITYSSGTKIRGKNILISFIIVGLISVLLFTNLKSIQNSEFLSANSQYPYQEASSLISQTLAQKSPGDLRLMGTSFSGKVFGNYSICTSGMYSCDYGKNEGENLNYLYCKPTFTSSYIFCYKQSIITEKGDIKKILNGCVNNFIFDPRNLTVISIDFGPLQEIAKSFC